MRSSSISKQFGEPQYEEGILDGPATDGGAAQDLFGDSPDAEADPLYDEAVAFVVRTRRASISSVQRQLRIGYNRGGASCRTDGDGRARVGDGHQRQPRSARARAGGIARRPPANCRQQPCACMTPVSGAA